MTQDLAYYTLSYIPKNAMSIFANKECNVRNTSYPPGWVFGGSSLSQDDVTLLEGVGVALGDERTVRPTEEPPVSDWPVEDGSGQSIRVVQRRVLPSFLPRKKHVFRSC